MGHSKIRMPVPSLFRRRSKSPPPQMQPQQEGKVNGPPAPAATSAEEEMARVFRKFDANGDGRISRSELAALFESLVKFREELTRPLQEAMEFMRRVESQLNSLSISGRSLRNILSSGTEIAAPHAPLTLMIFFLDRIGCLLVQ